MIKQTFLLFAATTLLYGCLATTDLATDTNISFEDRQLANQMSLLLQQRCTRHTYIQTTREKTSGDMRIYKKPQIKRLFKSPSGWVKAEASVDGVWDSIYFFKSTGQLICGERNWLDFPNSRSIEFVEIGKEEKNLPVLNTTMPDFNLSTREVRAVAIKWDGYSTLISIQASIDQSQRAGKISGSLPNNDGTCSGVFESTQGSKGIWTVSCTNGMSASGVYEAFGHGKGSSGYGKDTLGRSVQFTISGGQQ